MTLARFELRGRRPYAFDAGLLDMLFGFDCVTPNADTADAAATVVTIDGPLCGRSDDGWDSYEAIGLRFEAALASPTRAVVLRICSPGGDASGAPELAREMRRRADEVGKPVYAYADERACSAAYAIACAADSITLAETAYLGSIGIITTRVDLTAMNAERGVRVGVFTSGARKADGHPDAPLQDDEAAATQAQIDRFAEIYFELVAERRGLSADDVKALQAGVFQGADAVRVGLANNVEAYGAFMARVAKGTEIVMTKAEMRKALEEMAEGEGEDAARAKRALAAFDAEEAPADDEKAEDAPEDDKAEEPADDDDKAEEPPPKDDEKKSDDEKAQAVSRGELGSLRSEYQEFKALLQSERKAAEARERKEILASRPDITGDLRKELADSTLPIAKLRSLVKTMPKGRVPVTGKQALAAAGAKPTQGQTQGELEGPRLPLDQKAQMDEIMGLTTHKTGIVNTPTRQILGARLPAAKH